MNIKTSFLHMLGKIVGESPETARAKECARLRRQLPGLADAREFNREEAIRADKQGHPMSATGYRLAYQAACDNISAIEQELEKLEGIQLSQPLGVGA